MAAERIDGKAIARQIEGELKREAERFRAETGRAPGLAVIWVGDNPASAVYIRNKERAAKRVGIESTTYHLPADTAPQGLMELVERLNGDPRVDGILIQSPLPAGFDERAFVEAIDPAKDVDGFHAVNAGNLIIGSPCLRACTPKGVIRMLQASGVAMDGCHAVVVGRSTIVGKPQALMLLEQNATVTVCHSHTPDLGAITRQGDILVVAVGQPNLIRGDMIKPGATVIDVGMNRTDAGLCGDVCFAEAEQVAARLTPVPGGVGPMTIAMLMENTLEAARRHG